MDLLKILISVFFITFSLGEVAKIQFPNSISVGFFDLAVVLLSLFYLKKISKGRFVLKTPILLFIAVSVFSLIINFLLANLLFLTHTFNNFCIPIKKFVSFKQ